MMLLLRRPFTRSGFPTSSGRLVLEVPLGLPSDKHHLLQHHDVINQDFICSILYLDQIASQSPLSHIPPPHFFNK